MVKFRGAIFLRGAAIFLRGAAIFLRGAAIFSNGASIFWVLEVLEVSGSFS